LAVSIGGRVVTAAAVVVLVAVGAVLAVLGAFLVPLRLFGDVEGLSVVLAVLGNLLVGLAAGYGLESPWGAVAPGLGWLVTAGFLSSFAPRGGGVLIPGKLANDPGVVVVATLWLFGGLAAIGIAIAVTAIRRSSRALGLHQSGERAEA
jgi:hypothetical protein